MQDLNGTFPFDKTTDPEPAPDFQQSNTHTTDIRITCCTATKNTRTNSKYVSNDTKNQPKYWLDNNGDSVIVS